MLRASHRHTTQLTLHSLLAPALSPILPSLSLLFSRATHRYGGRLFGISINIGTLLQETNLGSTRWLRTAKNLPSAAKPVRPPSPSPPAASPSGVVVRSGGAAVSVSGGKPESFRAAEYLAKTLATGEPSDDFAA